MKSKKSRTHAYNIASIVKLSKSEAKNAFIDANKDKN